jgi:LPS-assembly protein
MKDQKVTDSVAGIEYDAGCWILRVVNKRQSTGQSETTQRWMIQLELTGLSSLGTNPLQVLKDNIPGYQLLRDDKTGAQSTSETP